MPRGLVIFLSIVAAVAVLGIWGLPWLKQTMFGESRQTLVNILSAEDDYEVEQATGTGKKIVSKTVVGMQIDFPMGSAPENTSELKVKSDEGKFLDVIWVGPETKEDNPDKGISRWTFREVFFPMGFRQGALWNQYRELCYFKLPAVTTKTP